MKNGEWGIENGKWKFENVSKSGVVIAEINYYLSSNLFSDEDS
jgi:hypothetical protein